MISRARLSRPSAVVFATHPASHPSAAEFGGPMLLARHVVVIPRPGIASANGLVAVFVSVSMPSELCRSRNFQLPQKEANARRE